MRPSPIGSLPPCASPTSWTRPTAPPHSATAVAAVCCSATTTWVRRQLGIHRGQELDTAGDGFLAAFDGPARAIRYAMAVRDEVRPLGLEIRAGLHTGECQRIGGKLAGLAVHIGPGWSD